MTAKDNKLELTTLVVQRTLPSEMVEAAPVASQNVIAYGSEERTLDELQLALSELPEESRPTTVARLLLPDGVRVDSVTVKLARGALPGKLAASHEVDVRVVVVPEPRPDGAVPAGHWVFVPAFGHAAFVSRGEDLHERLASELSMLPAALELDADGWRRVMSTGPIALVPVDVQLATTPLLQAQGRKALAEAERKRLAEATLDAAGRKLEGRDAPLVGRDELVAELGRVLANPRARSVLVVGDEAAGKTAIIEAWAAANRDRLVWATSVGELVAGASGQGEWQQRIASVLAAAETMKAILYFDDFGAVFADRAAEGGLELGASIRRHVVDGRVRIIGEITPIALDRAERRDVSLIGSMQRVTVPATDPDTTIAACNAWALMWSRTQPHRPQIAPGLVPIAVELARRYLPYRAFPGKAVRVLEELRVAHEQERDATGKGARLGESELYAAFSSATGIPVPLLADNQAVSIDDVITSLRRRLVGQHAAVRRVAEAICVAKARLQPADKPLASLLFVGPSGVGKTELARAVAANLFGAADKMVRLDMSEYTDPWAAERLFGGSDEDGRLTAAVRSQPFGVVLLDEIEKAHPSVFDLLLQVLGEARLTDGRGRTTYFHNAIIVLTSNLGTRGAKGKLGLAPDDARTNRDELRYREAVMGAFRPELINRLDQIVVFHPLQPHEIATVAEIAIRRLAERRGLVQGNVTLDVSERAVEILAEHGFSPDLGARALRRYIDSAVITPAARLLARSGGDAQGATLTVRAPDEDPDRPIGSRLGGHAGEVAVALWRRSATTSRRMVRSALTLGELRRDVDRKLAHTYAAQARDKLREIESVLATAVAKTPDGRSGLPGPEIARLSSEHARIGGLVTRSNDAQAEMRANEELCLEALARDVDAIELIDGAVTLHDRFRRELFWLVTAMRPIRPGATLLVHSPDAKAAVRAWVILVCEAAELRGWRATVHLFGDKRADWKYPWGPPHDLAWARSELASTAALVRVHGPGADTLFGLERGLHRFHGLAGGACHAWVDTIEPRFELSDAQWFGLPAPPIPRPARGEPMREVTITGSHITVGDDRYDITWPQLPARLEEVHVDRVLASTLSPGGLDGLWKWPSIEPPSDVKGLP